MNIGKWLAVIGGILIIIGLTLLPLNNPFHLAHVYSPGSTSGAGWNSLILTGVMIRPGITLVLSGMVFILISILFPKLLSLKKLFTKTKKEN